MKLLAISSSPRVKGNTDLLLDELLRGVRETWRANPEHSIEKIPLNDLTLRTCTHCDYCLKHLGCNVQDDMQPLYSKLIEADWLILASPIYFMAHCAQAKILIDRCQIFWAYKHMHHQPLPRTSPHPRRGIFVSVGASRGKNLFDGTKLTMKWFFDALQMEYWDNLLIDGIDAQGAILEHPDAMQQAFELGKKLARA